VRRNNNYDKNIYGVKGTLLPIKELHIHYSNPTMATNNIEDYRLIVHFSA
jgi:hypothetical protein